jgi:hypothetical protein
MKEFTMEAEGSRRAFLKSLVSAAGAMAVGSLPKTEAWIARQSLPMEVRQTRARRHSMARNTAQPGVSHESPASD